MQTPPPIPFKQVGLKTVYVFEGTIRGKPERIEVPVPGSALEHEPQLEAIIHNIASQAFQRRLDEAA